MGKAARFLLLLAGRIKPLLDQFSGAAAAYSLRSLSASTTNVVKVRRSGDDAELDFTATEVSDGTLASWVTAGGGTEDGFVTTWYDQSGNGKNATQTTAANQPKIVSSGSLVTENGKAAIGFDDANDKLEINETFNTSFSGFVTATAGGSRSVDIMRGGQSFAFLAGSVDATSGFRFRTNLTAIDYLALDTNQHLHTWINDTTNSFAAADGASFISGADAAISQTSLYISSSLAVNWIWDGTIQEIILYASDQSANRTGIEGNINDYYNIFS